MSTIIDKAIEILERDGWCTGTETNLEGQHCVVGALRWAEFELNLDCTSASHAENTMQMVLRNQTGCWFGAMQWNDDIAAGVDEVLHMLKLTGEELDLQAAR